MDDEREEPVEDLDVPDAEEIKGGKGHKGPKTDYLVVKLNDVLVTGVQPTKIEGS